VYLLGESLVESGGRGDIGEVRCTCLVSHWWRVEVGGRHSGGKGETLGRVGVLAW